MTHCTTRRFLLRLPHKSCRSPLTSPHLITQVYRLLVQMYVSLASIILLSSQHNMLILRSTSVLVYCPGNIHDYVSKKEYFSKVQVKPPLGRYMIFHYHDFFIFMLEKQFALLLIESLFLIPILESSNHM